MYIYKLYIYIYIYVYKYIYIYCIYICIKYIYIKYIYNTRWELITVGDLGIAHTIPNGSFSDYYINPVNDF